MNYYECPNGCVDGACVSAECSVDPLGCNNNYNVKLCGNTESREVWTGYEFEIKEVCLTPTEPGVSAAWSFDSKSCAIAEVCSGICVNGACVEDTLGCCYNESLGIFLVNTLEKDVATGTTPHEHKGRGIPKRVDFITEPKVFCPR